LRCPSTVTAATTTSASRSNLRPGFKNLSKTKIRRGCHGHRITISPGQQPIRIVFQKPGGQPAPSTPASGAKRKLLLIYPPLTVPTSPPLGSAMLKGYIERELPQWQVKVLDLN
jgi:hypothetical protein